MENQMKELIEVLDEKIDITDSIIAREVNRDMPDFQIIAVFSAEKMAYLSIQSLAYEMLNKEDDSETAKKTD